MTGQAKACARVDEILVDYAYGELAEGARRDLESHLADCADCRGSLEAIAGTRRLMQALPPEPAPEAGLESLLAYAEQAARRNAPVAAEASQSDAAAPARAERRRAIVVSRAPASRSKVWRWVLGAVPVGGLAAILLFMLQSAPRSLAPPVLEAQDHREALAGAPLVKPEPPAAAPAAAPPLSDEVASVAQAGWRAADRDRAPLGRPDADKQQGVSEGAKRRSKDFPSSPPKASALEPSQVVAQGAPTGSAVAPATFPKSEVDRPELEAKEDGKGQRIDGLEEAATVSGERRERMRTPGPARELAHRPAPRDLEPSAPHVARPERAPMEAAEPPAPRGHRAQVDDDFDRIFGGGGGPSPAAGSGETPKEKKGSAYTPAPPSPSAAGAVAPVRGQLGPGEITGVVAAHKEQIRRCVREQKTQDPSTTGTLIVRWEILPDGRTANVTVLTKELRDTPMASCMTSLVKTFRFPSYSGPPMEPTDFPFKF